MAQEKFSSTENELSDKVRVQDSFKSDLKTKIA